MPTRTMVEFTAPFFLNSLCSKLWTRKVEHSTMLMRKYRLFAPHDFLKRRSWPKKTVVSTLPQYLRALKFASGVRSPSFCESQSQVYFQKCSNHTKNKESIKWDNKVERLVGFVETIYTNYSEGILRTYPGAQPAPRYPSFIGMPIWNPFALRSTTPTKVIDTIERRSCRTR